MTENERTDQPAVVDDTALAAAEPAAAPEAPPAAAPPPTLDAQAILSQITVQPIEEAVAALKALAAEHTLAAAPVLALAAQQADLPLAARAMDVLTSLRAQEAADALAAIGNDRSDARRAKEARRALHKLSLAGVKPGVVAPPPRNEPEPDTVYACLASPIDGEGTRSITIVRQNRFDSLSMAVFMLNESLGVVDVIGAIPCSMSLWKRYLADADESEQRLTPVELAFCQQQIEVAVARSERNKTPLPDRYYMFIGLARGASEERPRPADLEPEAIQASPDLLAKSTELFALPECKTWLLSLDDTRPHALKVIAEVRREQQTKADRQDDFGVMDLGRIQRQGTLISTTMNALFDGARRAAFHERLIYTADILWRSDRLDEARWAMAAALALAPESTLPVDAHPFLRQVTMQSLMAAVEATELGITPEMLRDREALAKAAKEPPPQPDEYVDDEGNIRRKSGLIIPR